MVRRNEFVGIVAIGVVCLVLIAFSQKESRDGEPYEGGHGNASSLTLGEAVRLQRDAVGRSLADYEFPPDKQLEDFTMATGGRPLRTVIFTTWRSGSTFLGAVINAVPGNYYHYEPLLDYGIVQIRGAPYSESALRNLKDLLNCDYAHLRNYLNFGKTHTYLFTHNTRLWNLCEAFPHFCWNSTFLSDVCKVFPFQSVKTVRLRLRLAEELLKDQNLNVKVLLLVRDPRGTLQSRKHRDWCPGQPDCDKPNLLCADMVSDYSAAIQLKKSYHNRFRAMRYEDLSLDPYGNVRQLFDFFGLFFHRSVKEFLDSHTKKDVGGVSSTFRDSKSVPFHWKVDLNVSEIRHIEDNCDQAMKLWGYLKVGIGNEGRLREFNPLTQYAID